MINTNMLGVCEMGSYEKGTGITFTSGTAHLGCDAFYVGGAGDVVIVDGNGYELTFTAVQAGTLLPIKCKEILQTGTTATDIIALYL